MLQITTGKLFQRAAQRENALRGILYTNLYLEYMKDHAYGGPLFGRLVQTSGLSPSPKMIVYEFVERIEAPEAGLGALISHGADQYVQDMSMLISLFFECTCSPDIDLVRRLIGDQRGTATGQVPRSLVRKVFEKEVFSQPPASEEFVGFVNHLLGLQRKTFLGVMRAIRTYITGLHRVADDLELAYTLMVAAGESLTQEFDNYTSDWDSIPEQKRVPMDGALTDVEPATAERIRATMVSFEHVALGRRFQAFVAEHVLPTYFEGPFDEDVFPPGRSELPELLSMAYQARSQYVHQLQRLPDTVTLGPNRVETVLPIESRQRMLTLQGLARLIRHVIITFVHKQPVVEKEIYNYHREMTGVVFVRLSPCMWLADVNVDIGKVGRDKFEGFLEQISSMLSRAPGATVTDISDVLKRFLSLAPSLKKVERRPYWVMLILFNSIAGARSVSTNSTLDALSDADSAEPSAEVLLAFAFFQQTAPWTLEEQHSIFASYKRKRGSKNGIRFPRLLEAAVGLELAERYRSEGNFKQCHEIAALVADDYPEHESLRKFIKGITENTVINWRRLLLPVAEPASTELRRERAEPNKKHRSVKHRLRAMKPRKTRARL